MNHETIIFLVIFGYLAHLTVAGWTLAHCLNNCNTADKSAYTIAIILFPIGWILYWLLKPYTIAEHYSYSDAPAEKPRIPSQRPRYRTEIDYTEELLKPHTIAPIEQEIIAKRNEVAAKAHALTAGHVKPTPAKPIHVIDQERKTTQPPFTTS